MKKWALVVLTLLCCTLCACGITENGLFKNMNGGHGPKVKRTLTTQSGVELLNYSSSSAMEGGMAPMYLYCISVTTDGTICVENQCTNFTVPDDMRIYSSETLTPEQYEEIYDYFSKSELIKYDGIYDDYETCDGGYYFFNFTLEDGSTFRAGGLNPREEYFHEAEDFLYQYVTDDMKDEILDKTQAYNTYFEEEISEEGKQESSDEEEQGVDYWEKVLSEAQDKDEAEEALGELKNLLYDAKYATNEAQVLLLFDIKWKLEDEKVEFM